MRRKISQREAYRLLREVKQLREQTRRGLVNPYGGTFFWRINGLEQRTVEQMQTATRLGYAVLARRTENSLELFAVKS